MLFSSMSSPIAARVLSALLWVVVAGVLALSLVYTVLAAPVADDFCRAAVSSEPGAWLAYVREQYATWTGRWAAMAIYALAFPRLDFDTPVYALFVGLSLPLWIATFWMAIGILWRDALGGSARLKLATLLAALYWAVMPAPGETWYWATGMVEYQIPCMLAVACLALVASPHVLSGNRRALFVPGVAAVAIAFVVGGLNELVALYLLALLAIGAVLALAAGRPGAAALMGVVAIAAAVSLYINVTAPGGALRAAEDWPYRRTLHGFRIGMVRASDQSALAWMSDAKFWALGLLVLLSPQLSGAPRPWTLGPPPWPLARLKWWAVVALATLAAMLAGRMVVAYSQGWILPERVSNISLAWFMMGWLALVAALGPALVAALGPALLTTAGPRLRSGLALAACLVLVAGFASAPNVGRGLTELTQTRFDWRPAVEARADALRAAAEAGLTEVEVAPIDFAPHLYFWKDLSTEPGHWLNECVAAASGVDAVRLAAP